MLKSESTEKSESTDNAENTENTDTMTDDMTKHGRVWIVMVRIMMILAPCISC